MNSHTISSRAEKLLREVQAPYLVGEKREALAQFLSRLETAHGDVIRRVILFGSQARGDADEESDVDLLIVARDVESAREIRDFYIQVLPSWITILYYSEEEYREDQRLKPPLYVNIRRDGVELWNPEAQEAEERQVPLYFPEGEFRMLDYETIQTVRLYLRSMKEELAEAEVLEKAELIGGAVGRQYYAAFDLTTAALYLVNVVRGKHQGVSDAVNQFLVKTGLLEEEYAKSYTRLMEGRQNVDYRPQKTQAGEKILTEDELRQLLRDGERYIERMKRFLIERGIDESDFK